MRINTRALNKEETFCCSQKDVKKMFNLCDINISFAYYSRNYDRKSSFKEPEVRGKVIAKLRISNVYDAGIGTSDNMGNSTLNFYVIKKEEFSNELSKEFTEKVLPKIYEGYEKYINGNPGNISGVYIFRVELLDQKFILFEDLLNYSTFY